MAANTVTTEYYCFDALNSHFGYWRFLGVSSEEFPKRYQRILYRIHTTLMHLTIQLLFPLHITFGIFQLSDARDILEAVPLSFTFIMCAMNIYFLRGTLKVLQEIKEKSQIFEKKSRHNEEEFAFILEFKAKSKIYMTFYLALFTNLSISATISVLTFNSRQLLFPGYFPYDFTQNRLVYGLTVSYQLLAGIIQAYGQAHHYTYNGLLIHMLSQHLQILNLRISKIGYNSELSAEENHELLREAIKDYLQILLFHKKVNEAISKTTFALFLSSSLNIVSFMVLLVFFIENTYEQIYYAVAIICFVMNSVLCCYYGSEFEFNISNVTESFYSCNWYEQSKGFKMDLCIILECSLRKYEFIAGGLVPINKTTFVRIMKGAYSLFAVLNNLRQKF